MRLCGEIRLRVKGFNGKTTTHDIKVWLTEEQSDRLTDTKAVIVRVPLSRLDALSTTGTGQLVASPTRQGTDGTVARRSSRTAGRA